MDMVKVAENINHELFTTDGVGVSEFKSCGMRDEGREEKKREKRKDERRGLKEDDSITIFLQDWYPHHTCGTSTPCNVLNKQRIKGRNPGIQPPPSPSSSSFILFAKRVCQK